MKFYKLFFSIEKDGRHVYPDIVKGIVWNMTQSHYKQQVMIGATESVVQTDGETVIELSEQEALELIEEFKKSYPEPPKEDLP